VTLKKTKTTAGDSDQPVDVIQRPSAEVLYADELAMLAQSDTHPRPPGWRLSPRAVRTFILGDEGTRPLLTAR
jgi:hypothetical protein